MPTIDELQAEADRRTADLARAATLKSEERAKIYAEIASRDVESERLQKETRRRSAQAEYDRKMKEGEFAGSTEGQVLSYLKDLNASSQSTADSLRQIRNLIAFLIVAWTLVFILSLVFKGV
jgi:hypothetical protein